MGMSVKVIGCWAGMLLWRERKTDGSGFAKKVGMGVVNTFQMEDRVNQEVQRTAIKRIKSRKADDNDT